MKQKFVLIGASRRVGKDSLAQLLERELRNRNVIVQTQSFANQLRHECAHAFNMPGNPRLDFWTQNEHLKEDVVRPILIAWGQARRYQNENYWVDRLLATCDAGPIPSAVTIVSDWRFPNELTRIRDAGHAITAIHLTRPGVKPTAEEETFDPICRDLADISIANDGGWDKLEKRARLIADTLMT